MKQYILVGLLLLLIGTRFLLFYIYQPRLQNGQYISFTTTVINDPQRFSSYNILTAIYSNFWSYEKISLKYSPNISLNYGDRVVIAGKIIITQNNKLLKNKNAIVTMSFLKIEAKS